MYSTQIKVYIKSIRSEALWGSRESGGSLLELWVPFQRRPDPSMLGDGGPPRWGKSAKVWLFFHISRPETINCTIGGTSCELAQEVLQILLKDYLALEKEERSYKVDSRQLAGLLSYSDKHYRRLDKLQSRVAVVDLLLAQMWKYRNYLRFVL